MYLSKKGKLNILFIKKLSALKLNLALRKLRAFLGENRWRENMVSRFANGERYKKTLEKREGGRLMKYLPQANSISWVHPVSDRRARMLEITKIYQRAVALPRAVARIKSFEVTIYPLLFPIKLKVNMYMHARNMLVENLL